MQEWLKLFFGDSVFIFMQVQFVFELQSSSYTVVLKTDCHFPNWTLF